VKSGRASNRALRLAGMLTVRPGPFGETPDLFESGRSPSAITRSRTSTSPIRADIPRVRELLAALPGVDRTLVGAERAEVDLIHERSG